MRKSFRALFYTHKILALTKILINLIFCWDSRDFFLIEYFKITTKLKLKKLHFIKKPKKFSLTRKHISHFVKIRETFGRPTFWKWIMNIKDFEIFLLIQQSFRSSKNFESFILLSDYQDVIEDLVMNLLRHRLVSKIRDVTNKV